MAKLRAYLERVEAREHDTPAARDLRLELESALGTSDPDLRRADLRARQIMLLSHRS